MKGLSVLVLFVAIIGLSAVTVHAGSYFSGNVGVGFVSDFSVSNGIDKAELSFDPGFGVTAALGHDYGNGLRAEVELGYLESNLDKVSVAGSGSAPINGDGTIVSIMFNCFANYMPENRFSPFLGAGIGYAYTEIDIEGESEDDNLFAYQASAGLSITLTERLKSDVQYRYFGTSKFDPGAGLSGDTINVHMLALGLRYGF